MRVGILIIGSLYWDPSRVRSRWRESRLDCTGQRMVRVPIRYGKIAKTRGKTYTMVFAQSCAEEATLGRAIVVPTRAACCEPAHLAEEAEQLWIAEVNSESASGFFNEWGKVCILENPAGTKSAPVLQAWDARVRQAGAAYSPLPTAPEESAVLDATTGRALFAWPIDVQTGQPLAGFDLLLMTANRAAEASGFNYPSPSAVAQAWIADKFKNVNYFFSNRHHGIETFEDAEILAALRSTPSPIGKPASTDNR